MLRLYPLFCVLLTVAVVGSACRRRSRAESPSAGAPSGSTEQPTGSAAEGAGSSAPAVQFQAPPPTYQPPAVADDNPVRFAAPAPQNMYSPARPGDYQVQLDAYNRVLRAWAQNTATPQSLEALMVSYNSPKPPQPPAGRRLIYDPKTVTVRLQ